VFTNLVANAFEALDGRGRIAITVTRGSIDEAFEMLELAHRRA